MTLSDISRGARNNDIVADAILLSEGESVAAAERLRHQLQFAFNFPDPLNYPETGVGFNFALPKQAMRDAMLAVHLKSIDGARIAKLNHPETTMDEKRQILEKLQHCIITLRRDSLTIRNEVMQIAAEAVIPLAERNYAIPARGIAFGVYHYILWKLYGRQGSALRGLADLKKAARKRELEFFCYDPDTSSLKIYPLPTMVLHFPVRQEFVALPMREKYKHLALSAFDALTLARALKRGYHAITNAVGRLGSDAILSVSGGRVFAQCNHGALDYLHSGLSGVSLSIAPKQTPIIASVLRRLAGSPTIGQDAGTVLVCDDVISMIFKPLPATESPHQELIASTLAKCTSLTAPVHLLLHKLNFTEIVSSTRNHPSQPDWVEGAIIEEDGHRLKLECRSFAEYLSTYLDVQNVVNDAGYLHFTVDKLAFAWALRPVQTQIVGLYVNERALFLTETGDEYTMTHALPLRV